MLISEYHPYANFRKCPELPGYPDPLGISEQVVRCRSVVIVVRSDRLRAARPVKLLLLNAVRGLRNDGNKEISGGMGKAG